MFRKLLYAMVLLPSSTCVADVRMPLTVRPVDETYVMQSKNFMHASGWLVVDTYDDLPPFSVAFSTAGKVYKVTLVCNVRSRTCVAAIASLSYRGELNVETRNLRVRRFKKGTLVMDAEVSPTCQHQRWTVSLPENMVTIQGSLDTSNYSEEDGCPARAAFRAHLGTLQDALGNSRLDIRLHAAEGVRPGMDYADVKKLLGPPDSESCGSCERIERNYGDAVRLAVSKSTGKVIAIYVFDQPIGEDAK